MKLGYMTNSFGPLAGTGGGVTSMKDVGYITICEEEPVFREIASKGYRYVEIFEGNIAKYADCPERLSEALNKNELAILGVYMGCHFIYPDAREDELFKVEHICKICEKFQVKHIVLGGGAVRGRGIQESDYELAAKGIDAAAEIIKSHGMIPSYHPHLGSVAESPDQIHKLFSLTDVAFCPDIAHLAAGGGNALELIRQYFDRIHYIHLKDLAADGEFVPLGKGTIGLEEIINFLKDKQFSGDWLVEIDGYSGDPGEACETSYNYLKGKII